MRTMEQPFSCTSCKQSAQGCGPDMFEPSLGTSLQSNPANLSIQQPRHADNRQSHSAIITISQDEPLIML